jgi:hypothetical protein
MKTKLWHLFLMVGGALAVLSPDIANLASSLSAFDMPWLRWPVRALGIVALIGSRWDKIRAKVQPLLGPPSSGTPVAALLAIGAALLLAGPARADGPQFGGCVASGAVCFGPSATVTVGQFNFATSKFSGGIVPGIGYGATYGQSQWYATGLAAYLAFTVGKDAPNEAIPSLMLSFANYVRVGAGVSITETSGLVQTQWRLLFGLGSDFGGSPNYLSRSSK